MPTKTLRRLQPTSWLAERLHLSTTTIERLRITDPDSLPPCDLAPVFPDPSYSQRNAEPLTGDWRAWAA